MLKDMTMKTAQACQVIARNRGDAIVVSTMTGMAESFKASNGTKTVSSVPLMGGAAGLGLGLALAQPDSQVDCHRWRFQPVDAARLPRNGRGCGAEKLLPLSC